MLKKSITYVDFTDETVTEDFYFHMSKADLVRLEAEHRGGLAAWLDRITKSEDGKAIVAELENLILTSYGQKSEDGRRFIKNEQLRDEFKSSEAYSTLLFQLCTDAEAGAAFINGIVPPDLEKEMQKIAASRAREHPSDPAAKMLHPTPAEVAATQTEKLYGKPGMESTLGGRDQADAVADAQRTSRNIFENDRVSEDPVVSEEDRQWAQGPRVLTFAEARDMDADELRNGLALGRYTLS